MENKQTQTTCSYCNQSFATYEAMIDHVCPVLHQKIEDGVQNPLQPGITLNDIPEIFRPKKAKLQ